MARVERVGYTLGSLLLISGLLHLAILVTGAGSWQGPVSLRKAYIALAALVFAANLAGIQSF